MHTFSIHDLIAWSILLNLAYNNNTSTVHLWLVAVPADITKCQFNLCKTTHNTKKIIIQQICTQLIATPSSYAWSQITLQITNTLIKQIPYKQKIWLEKYLAKSIEYYFGEINLAIQGSHCIVKHQRICNWWNKFGDLHKKLSTTKFNSMPNFLLIWYHMYLLFYS